MSETSHKTFFTAKRIKLILTVFQYFYLLSAIMLLIAFLFQSVLGQFAIAILPPIIVATLIAYGIYNRKPWTPIVVTLLAAFGIVNNVLAIPGDILSSLIFLAFLIFEVYFFNRKDVKAHLRAKNILTLF